MANPEFTEVGIDRHAFRGTIGDIPFRCHVHWAVGRQASIAMGSRVSEARHTRYDGKIAVRRGSWTFYFLLLSMRRWMVGFITRLERAHSDRMDASYRAGAGEICGLCEQEVSTSALPIPFLFAFRLLGPA
jgi:hypothetical protein